MSSATSAMMHKRIVCASLLNVGPFIGLFSRIYVFFTKYSHSAFKHSSTTSAIMQQHIVRASRLSVGLLIGLFIQFVF